MIKNGRYMLCMSAIEIETHAIQKQYIYIFSGHARASTLCLSVS